MIRLRVLEWGIIELGLCRLADFVLDFCVHYS